MENYAAVLEEIIRAKPASAKGKYIKSITMTSSMGPGVKVDSSITRISWSRRSRRKDRPIDR